MCDDAIRIFEWRRHSTADLVQARASAHCGLLAFHPCPLHNDLRGRGTFVASRHASPKRRAWKPPHAADALPCPVSCWPQVPIDGVVEWGSCLVNEAMITGESELLPRRPGDRVIGGTINQVRG
jgi:hypothetical protein